MENFTALFGSQADPPPPPAALGFGAGKPPPPPPPPPGGGPAAAPPPTQATAPPGADKSAAGCGPFYLMRELPGEGWPIGARVEGWAGPVRALGAGPGKGGHACSDPGLMERVGKESRPKEEDFKLVPSFGRFPGTQPTLFAPSLASPLGSPKSHQEWQSQE